MIDFSPMVAWLVLVLVRVLAAVGPGPVSPLEAIADGVRLRLRIQPRASRSEVVGLHGDTIRIRLAAPPVDGAANEELVRYLAEVLGRAARGRSRSPPGTPAG